jgi:hypothetical protein
MRRLKTVVANTLYFLIQFAKQIFGMPSGTCRHVPSCSQFAREAIIELPPHLAIFRIFGRLLRCNPFGTYGFDPVIKNEKIIQRKNK